MATKKKKGKFKGVRYIETVLKKYYPKRYPTSSARREKARELYSLTAGLGKRVNVRNLLEIERIPRVKKITPPKKPKPGKKAPEIYPELLNPVQYYNLTNYPVWIQRTVKDVYFKSKAIFKSGSDEIQGGSRVSYREYFAAFVNFCNKKSQELGWLSSDEVIWYVKCNPPTPSISYPGFWDSEIVIVDADGNEESFGFDPEAPEEPGVTPPPRGPKKPEPPQGPPTPPAGPPTGSDELEIQKLKAEQAKAEAEKAKFESEKARFEAEKAKSDQIKWEQIKKAMDMLEAGKISESTFNLIISKI